jgi:hypothetical protein
VRAALGARRDAPDQWVVPAGATIRRALARVDPTALAAVVGARLADRPGQQRRRAVAVDGKTLRGAKRDDRQVHLLACMDHATRAVLTQHQVNGALVRCPPSSAAGRPGPRRRRGHRRRAAPHADAALRQHARDPTRPRATSGSPSDEPDITTERRSPDQWGQHEW